MKQLLYFSAPWCGPCKTLGPIMDQVSHQAKVKKVNVDIVLKWLPIMEYEAYLL